MGTQSSKARTEQRESQWRDRMRRHAASGQSVAEFCRHESVSDASFYLWRARFRACVFPGAAAKGKTRRIRGACVAGGGEHAA
jgi:hypothetical protein